MGIDKSKFVIDFQIVLAVIDIEIYYKSNASAGGKVEYTLGWYDEGTANAIVRKLREDGYKVDTDLSGTRRVLEVSLI